MKKTIMKLMVLVLLATSLLGCYGKFAITRKVYSLNGQVSDKFLRSGLTWVFLIVPVYGIAGLVDFVVFNTIEFWSGKNPVAEVEKTIQYVDGADRYEIHARKSGDDIKYTITHYNFDSYVDSLQVDWNQVQDIARSKFTSGGIVTENYAGRDADGVHVQVRPIGYLPLTVALADR
jgi:hypothetical protein